jgi:hypothetical protein
MLPVYIYIRIKGEREADDNTNNNTTTTAAAAREKNQIEYVSKD